MKNNTNDFVFNKTKNILKKAGENQYFRDIWDMRVSVLQDIQYYLRKILNRFILICMILSTNIIIKNNWHIHITIALSIAIILFSYPIIKLFFALKKEEINLTKIINSEILSINDNMNNK